jgi:uncharacterized protein
MGTISTDLIGAIIDQYKLPLDGFHGLNHWARVLSNGRRLAQSTGAVAAVVELFAVFHDACRENDGRDDDHGLRGARLAKSLRNQLFKISDAHFELLHEACALHSEGRIEGDITVQTCWDADRLDLGRVAIHPGLHKLCTAAAQDRALISWADQRAREDFKPATILADWGCD